MDKHLPQLVQLLLTTGIGNPSIPCRKEMFSQTLHAPQPVHMPLTSTLFMLSIAISPYTKEHHMIVMLSENI